MATFEWTKVEELKRDGLGAVERWTGANGVWVRRIASGGRWPGSRVLARWLLRRERRAIQALQGVRGVPTVLDAACANEPPSSGRDATLLRSWIPGEALPMARALPENFFLLLSDLVRRVHARGVCHNDLHKENNIVVGPDGCPALIDFQLASVHSRRDPLFASRCREDLRHVNKHRVRYERQGRLRPEDLPPRGRLAKAWAVLIQPSWRRLRRCFGEPVGELRRPRTGPWPQWTPPVDATLHEEPAPHAPTAQSFRRS